MTSAEEMAGGPGENPVADAVHAGRIQGSDGARGLIAARVAAVPGYARRFNWLRGTPAPVHISEIGNALAAFIAFEFRATNSPFDAILRGEYSGMSNEALLGMALFYGKAQCSTCHAGAFQTDHSFHALGIPPLGPGKGHGASTYADHGRAAVTQNPEDAYHFRTPSLRNVTLTAPYGHNGAYATLEDMIAHHLDPLTMLAEYMPDKARLHDVDLAVPDTASLDDFDEMLRIAMSVSIEPVPLKPSETRALIAFLHTLEDKDAASGRLGAPSSVPSGLPLDALTD